MEFIQISMVFGNKKLKNVQLTHYLSPMFRGIRATESTQHHGVMLYEEIFDW